MLKLLLPEAETKPIGVWGQRHRRYLKEHKRAIYTTLLTSGKLNGCLADIDEQAEKMFFRLVKQMAERIFFPTTILYFLSCQAIYYA